MTAIAEDLFIAWLAWAVDYFTPSAPPAAPAPRRGPSWSNLLDMPTDPRVAHLNTRKDSRK